MFTLSNSLFFPSVSDTTKWKGRIEDVASLSSLVITMVACLKGDRINLVLGVISFVGNLIGGHAVSQVPYLQSVQQDVEQMTVNNQSLARSVRRVGDVAAQVAATATGMQKLEKDVGRDLRSSQQAYVHLEGCLATDQTKIESTVARLESALTTSTQRQEHYVRNFAQNNTGIAERLEQARHRVDVLVQEVKTARQEMHSLQLQLASLQDENSQQFKLAGIYAAENDRLKKQLEELRQIGTLTNADVSPMAGRAELLGDAARTLVQSVDRLNEATGRAGALLLRGSAALALPPVAVAAARRPVLLSPATGGASNE